MAVSFELVSPEKLLLSEDVDMVVVPGAEGDFGVLEGHAPLISSLRAGVIAIYRGETISRQIFVAGGFTEVTHERCTVLAEEARAVEDIDRAEAEGRVRAARARLEQSDNDTPAARTELAVAEEMLASLDRL